MSKYHRLKTYLHGQGGEWFSTSFSQVESVLGFPLPASARKHRAWWTNLLDGTHTQAHAWMDAGWRVWSVDLAAGRLEFQRMAAEQGMGVSEATAATFRHDTPGVRMTDPVAFDRAKLSITARRILSDYTAEFDGDVQRALDKALHEARVAFRQRLFDNIPREPYSPVDSVDLIREDRDAR
jgi:hypothetical protein